MKVWAVANQKGGVGKTTTVVALAGWQTHRGGRTLMVDLDPHGSLTGYFGFDVDGVEQGVYTLFRDRSTAVAPLIQQTDYEGLYLLPASPAMATLDKQLGAQDGMGLVIARTVQQVADQFDYVMLDCPPMLGVLMVNALAACEHLLIPVQTEFLAMKGLERMTRTLAMIMQSKKTSLPYTIVPTMYDRRTRASGQTLNYLREHYSDAMWSSVIPVDTLFRDASRSGVPLPLMAPRSRGAVAYAELLDSLATAKSSSDTAVA